MRWEAWGEGAFRRAQEEGKRVLLVLTAAWCHACRQMDQEVWGNPAVAARARTSVVPVLVDADLRPYLYARYHLGALPSVVLLTPDGEFIRGGLR